MSGHSEFSCSPVALVFVGLKLVVGEISITPQGGISPGVEVLMLRIKLFCDRPNAHL